MAAKEFSQKTNSHKSYTTLFYFCQVDKYKKTRSI